MRQTRDAARDLLTDDAKWAAVVARDARFDGRLFYAVTTTGVFCRPSCGSRRPLRTNVRFFASSADAAKSGFRACKRCKPAEHHLEGNLFEEIRRLIDAAADDSVTLGVLARQTGATPTRIH